MPSGRRGKTEITANLRAENFAASLLMDAVAEPNATLRRDEAGASAPPLPPLHGVAFGWLAEALSGEALGERTRALLLILTHVWRGNVLAAKQAFEREI